MSWFVACAPTPLNGRLGEVYIGYVDHQTPKIQNHLDKWIRVHFPYNLPLFGD
jgi:hypothetical protein